MSDIKILSPQEFRKMQLIQLDMLIELDRVCRKNNIKYTIYGGTLLGAVRHKGYIPWDDDADVAMLREEYEKFKKAIDQLDSSICFFQDHDTDPEYRWGYGKLRRTGTKYVRVGQEHLKCKTGVFIDVFPMDDIPLSLAGQVWFDFYMMCLRKILYSEVGKVSKSCSGLIRKIYSIISHIKPDKVFKIIKRYEKKSKNTTTNRVRVLMYPSTGKLNKKNPFCNRFGVPKKWLTDLTEYEFEGVKLLGARDYDEVLQYYYGDYMQLPSEENRNPHAPVSEYSF